MKEGWQERRWDGAEVFREVLADCAMRWAVLEFGTATSWRDEPEMCFALNLGAAVVFLLDLRGH